jgi:hypothetical protein
VTVEEAYKKTRKNTGLQNKIGCRRAVSSVVFPHKITVHGHFILLKIA